MPLQKSKKKSSENTSASQTEMLTDSDNKDSLFKPCRFLLSIHSGAVLDRFDLPLLKEQDVLVYKWIMFAEHQLVSETVPFGVEEISCPCSTHHLHQDGL